MELDGLITKIADRPRVRESEAVAAMPRLVVAHQWTLHSLVS